MAIIEHGCNICHGLTKVKCIFCGMTRPKKKDMTEMERLQFEAWEERIKFLKYIFHNRIKFGEDTTQDVDLDNEVKRLIGDYTKVIQRNKLLEQEKARYLAMRFKYEGKTVHLQKKTYENHRLAILVVSSDGEPLATLTVNLPNHRLEPGEFFVKNYSENIGIAEAAMASGLFEATGKEVPHGWVNIPVWRFKE